MPLKLMAIVAAPQLPLAPSAERLGAVDEGILPVPVSEHTMGYETLCGTHKYSPSTIPLLSRAKLFNSESLKSIGDIDMNNAFELSYTSIYDFILR